MSLIDTPATAARRPVLVRTPVGRVIPPSSFADPVLKRDPFVVHRFRLNDAARDQIRAMAYRFGFGGFGEAVYYRTYSRLMADGRQESWPDTVLRVVDGVMSIRKDWYMRCRLPWDEGKWQDTATELAVAIHQMHLLPPGRGLWAMGSSYVYERGSMALFNCAATAVDVGSIAADLGWVMDALMCGVGVGIEAVPKPYKLRRPEGAQAVYVVPDSREGWVESVELLIRSYEQGSAPVGFDYSLVRPAGRPLMGLGGVAAGPEPLMRLHDHIQTACERYIGGEFGPTRLIADLANGIGVCVVMGNVRRSAEILIGSMADTEFLDLKDYDLHPERKAWGWMSNNSVALEKHQDFEAMPAIASRIRRNGEPGYINRVAIQKFARFGREMPDAATLINPCGEIPLESKELCNLAEVFPTRCPDDAAIFRAVRLATLYSSTVALLPTHRPETNIVMARNRRIGVSLSGIAEWIDTTGASRMTRILRDGYKVVRAENKRLAVEAGVPESIRVTTVKPSGTISQLVGVPSGMHFPQFQQAIRRMRVARGSAVATALADAGYPNEPDRDEPTNTLVFEFPIDQGAARKATDVSVWEQALMLCTLQREWADNAVSVTLNFDPATEADDLEHLLAQIAPMVKSVSALPHTPEGAYAQMPYQEIVRAEYDRRRAAVRPIDWSTFRGDGADEKFCEGGMCRVAPKTPPAATNGNGTH